MKVYAKLLTLCSVLGASSAFTSPKVVKPSSALHSSNWDVSSLPDVARVEGQSRRTWNFADITREDVQVAMKTDGRPMKAEIQLWIGPDWTPFTVKTYCQDGKIRPVQAVIGTRNKAAQIEVRNTGAYEFPLNAACQYAEAPLVDIRKTIPDMVEPIYIEGGAIKSKPISPTVNQVAVLLKTDSRQLNAVVELMNGPNNVKQDYEVFTNNGILNSLYVVFDTPGTGGNTVRARNLAPLEFPCWMYVQEL